MRLRLATRGSPLAVAQSGMMAGRLRALGHEVELLTVKTSGDVLPHDRWETEGTKGLFVKEIEEALLAGTADLAVHSSKDLPAELPPGLVLAAFPEREDPRDVLVSGAQRPGLAGLPPGAVVGTASARRRIQLAMLRPDLAFDMIRGNVDTRLRKLSEGACAALVLAAAGLKRLGRGEVVVEHLDPEKLVPAPGQGALALEARADRPEVLKALAALDHAPTRAAVVAERVFMAAMGGGCRMPLGAHATLAGASMRLKVFHAEPGAAAGRHDAAEFPAREAREGALRLAEKMRRPA